jgi:aldose 1-epimerase
MIMGHSKLQMDFGKNVELRAGKLRIEVSPALGGAISAFEWLDGHSAVQIMRKGRLAVAGVLNVASFPVVPNARRIWSGVPRTLGGRQITVAPDGVLAPVHGQSRIDPWLADQGSERRARLHFRHERGEWPWAYEARQDFALDELGLTVILACRNLGHEPMPCGLAQHFCFPCGPVTRVDTAGAQLSITNDNLLPVENAPVKIDLRDKLLCEEPFNHSFKGWSGEVRFSDPGWPYILRMRCPDAYYFQLYSQPQHGLFVVGPATHANGALSERESEWERLGVRMLGPGEDTVLAVRLDVLPSVAEALFRTTDDEGNVS